MEETRTWSDGRIQDSTGSTSATSTARVKTRKLSWSRLLRLGSSQPASRSTSSKHREARRNANYNYRASGRCSDPRGWLHERRNSRRAFYSEVQREQTLQGRRYNQGSILGLRQRLLNDKVR